MVAVVASEMKPGDIIYLVIHTDYDDYEILGAFTTWTDAQEFESELYERRVRYSPGTFYNTSIITLRAETVDEAKQRIHPSGEGWLKLAQAPEGET